MGKSCRLRASAGALAVFCAACVGTVEYIAALADVSEEVSASADSSARGWLSADDAGLDAHVLDDASDDARASDTHDSLQPDAFEPQGASFEASRRLYRERVRAVAVDAKTQTLALALHGQKLVVFTHTQLGFTRSSFELAGEATALAVDGGTIAVGEAHADEGAGLVELFLRSDHGFVASQTLRAAPDLERSSPQGGAFGASVAVHEATLVVGEPAARSRSGRVHVYTRRGHTWKDAELFTLEAVPEPEPCYPMPAYESFGESVALMPHEGRLCLVVGKAGNGQVCAYKPEPLPGRVYVYESDGTAFPRQPTRTLGAPHPEAFAHFGAHLAAAEGVIVVSRRASVDAFFGAQSAPTLTVPLPALDYERARLSFDGTLLAIALGTDVHLYSHQGRGRFIALGELSLRGTLMEHGRLSVAVGGSLGVIVGVPAELPEHAGAFAYDALSLERSQPLD